MNDDTIYEPLKMYESLYKEKVNQEALDTLDKLIKESKVDESINADLVKKYQKALNDSNKADATLRKYKGFRTFIYVLMSLAIVGAIYLFYKHSSTAFIIIGVVCVVLAIACLCYNILRLNKIVKHSQEICAALDKKEKDAMNECLNQVAPLNNLFDFNMASNIIERAVPMIQMDDYFNNERLEMLVKHFGYKPDVDDKTSTILCQSGTLNDNPFIIIRNRVQTMGTRTYTGTRIITWTERVTDSDGDTHVVTRSQTLVATVVKPIPEYHNETYLVYGNEAGSNLKFTRNPTYDKDIGDQKDIDKFVRKREDDIERYAEKASRDGRNFTPLSNTEFEILFNALDRTNEVEFRFLFTPLAQNNEVDLITKNKYYGDDFTFNKYGPINYLHSRHIQNFDLYQDPRRFFSHDVKQIRTNFVSYVNDYFRNIYFELAPLLAIPAYQNTKPTGFVYDDSLLNNLPGYVDEVMSNTFNNALIKPANANTESIIKINSVRKVGDTDLVNIEANSFYSVREVEFVPRLGGDGRMHNVPVYFDHYYPCSKETTIGVHKFHIKRKDCQESIGKVENYLKDYGINDVVYKAGLVSFIVAGGFSSENDMELSKIIGYNKDNLGGN